MAVLLAACGGAAAPSPATPVQVEPEGGDPPESSASTAPTVSGTLLVHRNRPGEAPRLCEVAPAGSELACDTVSGRFAGPTRPGQPFIAAIEVVEDAAGHRERLVRWDGPGAPVTELLGFQDQVRDPAFSAEGRLVVAHMVDGVSVVSEVGGEGTERLLDHPAGTFEPSFGADGALLVAASRDGNAELYRLAADPAADGHGLVRLTEEPADDMRPRESSRGLLGFLSDRDGTRRVWLQARQGARAIPVASPDTHVDLAFSPDGDRLAVVGGPAPSEVSVRIVDLSSGEERVRIGGASFTAEQPAWSADGAFIALTCRRPDQPPGVCVVDSETGDVVSEIVVPGEELWLPRWRP